MRVRLVDLSGHRIWERLLLPPQRVDASVLRVQGSRIFAQVNSHLFVLDLAGKVQWHWDTQQEDVLGWPMTLYPDGFLIAGYQKITRFEMGAPPALPTDPAQRRTLAKSLIGHTEWLNKEERNILEELGRDAYVVIRETFRNRIQKTHPSASASNTHPPTQEVPSAPIYMLGEYLSLVMRPQDTRELLDILMQVPASTQDTDSREILLSVLADRGDDRLTTPMFLKIVRNTRARRSGASLETPIVIRHLLGSSAPRAVDYSIALLADEKAEPEFRHLAFIHLARTGGRKGLEAVLAARDRRRTVPSLERFLRLENLGTTVKKFDGVSAHDDIFPAHLLATHTDAQGRLWGLINSRALGAAGDLWVAHYEGRHWKEPLFSGISLYKRVGRGKTGPPPTFMGLTEKELVAGGGWVRKLVGNTQMSRDTDRDGWTDLVEIRMGTDPRKADTDGDGLKDSLDKNPLAAPHPLTDTEQILAAAFESRFRFLGARDVPCAVFLPRGVRSIPFAGWDWIILAVKPSTKNPMMDLGNLGYMGVEFFPPMHDFDGVERPHRKRDPLILWNPDHTEARVSISSFYWQTGGEKRNIHLKKYGRTWVVIEEQLGPVS